MTSAATATPRRPTASSPRETKPLEPVDPVVELVEYDLETGTGIVQIDEHRYVMIRFRDQGKTIGMRLTRFCSKKGLRKIDVDFTAKPWACDCEDAAYRSERPGGCKHIVAMRKVIEQMKCRKAS